MKVLHNYQSHKNSELNLGFVDEDGDEDHLPRYSAVCCSFHSNLDKRAPKKKRKKKVRVFWQPVSSVSIEEIKMGLKSPTCLSWQPWSLGLWLRGLKKKNLNLKGGEGMRRAGRGGYDRERR